MCAEWRGEDDREQRVVGHARLCAMSSAIILVGSIHSAAPVQAA
ncbi:hypothetical protein [Shewanella sp.]